ncbi:MAG TPA: DsbA family protein [Ginsengibacter sp.]|nr:DsbA family protein [Ginsengibacter sp.]
MVNQKQAPLDQNKNIDQSKDLVEITYYTDPLCCWSWAFEPQWRRLQYELRGKLSVRYCMGGLIADWKNFNDEVNSISRPFQMGSLWAQAQNVSGMPIQDLIWINDPPATSYPACIAVKCAGIQSRYAEQKFLRYVREAIMLHGLNIAKQILLFDIAKTVEAEGIDFNTDRFINDFISGAGADAFRKDLQEVKYKNINRFPTLTISVSGKRGVIITGYRPYPVLNDAIKQIVNTTNTDDKIDIDDYKQFFGNLMQREIDEIKFDSIPGRI